MPYDNLPESEWAEMDRCVTDVMKGGKDKQAAIAVCYASITEKASNDPKDYLIVEDSEKPATWHLQVRTNGKPDHRLMGAAWAALHGGYRGNVYEGAGKQSALDELKKLYESEGMPVPSTKESALSVFKQADGKWRWVMSTTSSFRDRDGEIVSQKALEDDTAQMNTSGNFGGLDWWHLCILDGELTTMNGKSFDEIKRAVPISLGTCDFSAMHGLASIESGLFNSNLVGQRFAKRSNEFAASRSFLHGISDPDADGVYSRIATFSRAILPRGKESNLLTRLYAAKEKQKMNMVLDQIKSLIDKLGGDEAAEKEVETILASSLQEQADLLKAGAVHKEVTPDTAPVVPEVKADAAPPADGGSGDASPMLAMDLKPDELAALVVAAVQKGLEPLLAQFEQVKQSNSAAAKEVGTGIVAEIAKVAQMQTALDARLKDLEGETPRAFRASQSAATVVKEGSAVKGAQPGADAQAKTYFETFIANLTGPQPPA
jgi:hypothetical protein